MSEENGSAPSAEATPAESTEGAEVTEQQQDVGEQQALSKRKYKYKADGKDYEEELDDSELQRRLSLSKAAYKRMEEAAITKKQAETFVKMLQDDPLKVLTHPQFGGNKKFREIAESFLARELEQEMLSPGEIKQRQMEERLRQYEEQEKTQKQKAEEAQMLKLQEHYQQDYEQKIIKGLQSQNLPKTPKTVRRMAELMAKSAEHGIDLDPEHLAEIVRQDYVNEMREMFGSTEGDMLLNLLGEDVGNKIRKADLAKLKGGASTQQKFQAQPQAPAERKGKVKSSDYEAHLKKRLGLK